MKITDTRKTYLCNRIGDITKNVAEVSPGSMLIKFVCNGTEDYLNISMADHFEKEHKLELYFLKYKPDLSPLKPKVVG